jgi:hypothetical protein
LKKNKQHIKNDGGESRIDGSALMRFYQTLVAAQFIIING